MALRKIGQPVTVGELRKMLNDYPDDCSFGFRNQPMQELVESVYNNEKFVSFQEIAEPLKLVPANNLSIGDVTRLTPSGFEWVVISSKEDEIFIERVDDNGSLVNISISSQRLIYK